MGAHKPCTSSDLYWDSVCVKHSQKQHMRTVMWACVL
jgi:hypothetical protein